MTLMIPMPATESEMAAMPARAAVRRARIRLNEVSTASCVVIVTSSKPSWRSLSKAMARFFPSSISSCEASSTMIWESPRWSKRLRACDTGTWMTSSRSVPNDTPRGDITPMTLNRFSPRRSVSPSGFRPRNSSSWSLAPITHTRSPRSSSRAGR